MIEVGSKVRIKSEQNKGVDAIYTVYSIPYPQVENRVMILHPSPQHTVLHYENELVEVFPQIKVICTPK